MIRDGSLMLTTLLNKLINCEYEVPGLETLQEELASYVLSIYKMAYASANPIDNIIEPSFINSSLYDAINSHEIKFPSNIKLETLETSVNEWIVFPNEPFVCIKTELITVLYRIYKDQRQNEYKQQFELLVKSKKEDWKQQAVQHAVFCLTDSSAMVDAINTRMSVRKINTNQAQSASTDLNATDLDIALDAFDRNDISTYAYDEARVSEYLKNAGFSTSELNPSAIIRYDAVIFTTLGKILMLNESNAPSEAYTAYMYLFAEYPDNIDETNEDQKQFKIELTNLLIPLINKDMKRATSPTREHHRSDDNDLRSSIIGSTETKPCSSLDSLNQPVVQNNAQIKPFMTRIFAPFGVGLTANAISGLVAAVTVTGTTVTTLAYSIYQKYIKMKATDDNNDGELADDSIAPSPSNATILNLLTTNNNNAVTGTCNHFSFPEPAGQSNTRNTTLFVTASVTQPLDSQAPAPNESKDDGSSAHLQVVGSVI